MQTAKPQITVIIPTYKRPRLLKRAVRSVLNQTYPNFQICIYDNASEDETESVVRELAREDERVKYHRHPKNIGMFANFNYGLQHVDTPFFSFLSDDDFLLPDFFETTMQNFIKYPDAAFSAGLTVHFDGKHIYLFEALHWKREGYYPPHEGLYWYLKHYLTWTGVLFNKKVLAFVGLLDIEMGPFLDYEFVLRIVGQHPIIVTKKPSAVFCWHDAGASSSVEYRDEFYHGWLKLMNNFTEDETIKIRDRKRAIELLKKHFSQYFSFMAITSIINNHIGLAYKVVNVLNNLDPVKASILATSLRLFEYFPSLRRLFVYYCPILLYAARITQSKLFAKGKSSLQKRIRQYAQFLEI